MARKPGNINPEGSGKGSMPLGSSSQAARAGANRAAGAGRAARAAQAKAKSDIFKPATPESMKRIATKGFSKSEIDDLTDWANAVLKARYGKNWPGGR